MKRESFFFSFFLLLALMPAAVDAQCSGSCSTGALTTLPANGIIAAGTNYCISGTTSNTSAFTISGTLVIQSGTVTLGSTTLNSTGMIVVQTGAQLILNGLTGQYGVTSAVENVVICTGGFLQVTGSFLQYGLNMELNNYSVLLITGSWNAYASTPFSVDIGAGALVEDCGAFTLDNNNFFTETSTGTSYVFIRGSITQGATPGWLSSSEGSSLINLTVQGSVSGLSYPAANSCTNFCSSTSLLPPGTTTTSTCGSTSDSYILITLPLYIIDFSEQPAGGSLDFSADINSGVPVSQVWLQSSSLDNGRSFTTLPYEASESPGVGGAAHYLFTLPMPLTPTSYRLMATSGPVTVYSSILAPGFTSAGSGAARVYPDPATNFIYLQQPGAAGYTQAVVVNTAGQLMQVYAVPAGGGIVRLDLPARLSAGMYFVRFTGGGLTPLTVPVLKTQ